MAQDGSGNWSQQQYWQQRFEHSDTPWELGHPSSALFEAWNRLRGLGFRPSEAGVVIPGCGTGSDALELARKGMQVFALDWSPLAIRTLLARATEEGLSGSITTAVGSFFDIPARPVDAFAEHTFFCAIDPSRRSAYARRAAEWVKPGGYLFGNFFVLEETAARSLPALSMSDQGEGPPFVSTKESLLRDLAGFFESVVLERATHPEPDRRPGMEWIGIFRRKPQ